MHSKYLFIAIFLLLNIHTFAQFSAQNLIEYQNGQLPTDTSGYFATVYDRAGVQYKKDHFKGSLNVEQFHSPYEDRNYMHIQQYQLQYSKKPLTLTVGHLYETIGRGLLLRSYEVPDAIIEDNSYRSRHYFHRDIAGFSGTYKTKYYKIGAVYGKPLNYVFPPTVDAELRRPDLIQAVTGELNVKKQTLGGAYMQVLHPNEKENYAMLTSSGQVTKYVDYYTEIARDVTDSTITRFEELDKFAIYVNVNLTFGSLGIATEYKKYQNFVIGSGINEPPALVKEHSSRLLNRSTHVMQPFNEEGFQVEAFYMFKNFSVLTFNHAQAKNDFGKRFDFFEYYLEYSFDLLGKHPFKVFGDYAQEDINLEKNRYTAGVSSSISLNKTYTVNVDLEAQTFDRLDDSPQNFLFGLGIDKSSKLNVSVLTEMSSDPFISEEIENVFWTGVSTSYKIDKHNTIYVFAGKRRGGPACNAGICYEVPDFEGVEIRMKTRF